MRRLQSLLIVMTCGLAAAVSSSVQAEGFMSTPPKVGTAVTYSFETTMFGEGEEERSKGEITLSCVDKEEVDGAPAYWIEVKRPKFGEDSLLVYKLLVSEKKFAAGEDPFEGFVRGYFKGDADGDEVNKIDTGGDEWWFRKMFLAPIPSFETLKGNTTEKITIKDLELGELECQVRTGTVEFKIAEDASGGTDGELFLSDKVPFGMVQAELATDVVLGESGFSLENKLTLKKITTKGVKSEIPDAK